ncbi:MAG: hypothetical protein A2X23_11065 [Chloroflexi bacterium GWC2_73_18]|nr:MAG: hypothetical protein A2X23_11065 [Chloroflexi bacterium GWC2_73_18]
MEIPLFPLATVLCPGGLLPLHVFEERYRSLVARCLATGAPFGVVLLYRGSAVEEGAVPLAPDALAPHALAPHALAPVGTLAAIRDVTRLPDGRMDLLAVGTARFRLHDVEAGREPYLVGRVTLLDEPVGDPQVAHRLAREAGRHFREYLDLRQVGQRAREGRLGVLSADSPAAARSAGATADLPGTAEPSRSTGSSTSTDRTAAIDALDPTALGHLLSGLVIVDLATRQALLEAPTTELRLRSLDRLLRREIELLGRGLLPLVVGRASDRSRAN